MADEEPELYETSSLDLTFEDYNDDDIHYNKHTAFLKTTRKKLQVFRNVPRLKLRFCDDWTCTQTGTASR